MTYPAASPEPASPSGAHQLGRAAPPAHLREVGGLAAWSVTSAKPGNGVELLRDGSTDTYWQSDGTQPHLVSIQFNKRTEVTEVHLYLDYKADESYTPCRLSVRAGCSYHDLKDVCIVELREPTGWIVVPLSQQPPQQQQLQQQQQLGAPAERPLKAFFYQVAVLTNHQNGRDTHIRQILLYGPSAQAASSAAALTTLDGSGFSSIR